MAAVAADPRPPRDAQRGVRPAVRQRRSGQARHGVEPWILYRRSRYDALHPFRRPAGVVSDRRRPLYPRWLSGAERPAGGHHSRGRRRGRGRPRGRDHPAGWRPHARRAAPCAQDRRRRGRARADRVRKRSANRSGGNAAGRQAHHVPVALPGAASIDLAVDHVARTEPAFARLRGAHYSTSILPSWLTTLSGFREAAAILGEDSEDRITPYGFVAYDQIDSGLNADGPYLAALVGLDRVQNWAGLTSEAKRAQGALDGSHCRRSRPTIPRHRRSHRPSRDVDIG